MIEVRHATEAEAGWLFRQDDITAESVLRRVKQGEYILALKDAEHAGFMRYSLFWSTIPYMEMIRVVPRLRRQGLGTAMHRFWEQEMRRQDHKLLMTSSMKDEPPPQAWHRRNGYVTSGELTFGRVQAVPEVFFVKDLA
ncbi:MAG: GNAT family N-acetyltransferase [Planctomycetota bacterium]